jgi:transcriptional regulator with GAF, ATPase, and Fis domain
VPFERIEEAAQRVVQGARAADPAHLHPLGNSPAWLCALEQARRAAATEADILIEAESGTGKEVLARFIHRQSSRRSHPLVAVNCAAFPESLLESELFGHARGAFTGAATAKPGKFELAHGGTLLLDEVGEMPLSLQPKLLRVLQEREFDRLGDTRSIRVDVRVIATTNRGLEEMVRTGAFRADLYYRLNVIPLAIPPLRERRDDIALLAHHYACTYAPPGKPPTLSPGLLEQLQNYEWPGNVRELANLMRRIVALGPPGTLGPEALVGSALHRMKVIPRPERLAPGLSLEQAEKRLFEVTLDATGGNRSRAAEMLGVSLRTVRNKIRDYGLPSRRSYAHE